MVRTKGLIAPPQRVSVAEFPPAPPSPPARNTRADATSNPRGRALSPPADTSGLVAAPHAIARAFGSFWGGGSRLCDDYIALGAIGFGDDVVGGEGEIRSN